MSEALPTDEPAPASEAASEPRVEPAQAQEAPFVPREEPAPAPEDAPAPQDEAAPLQEDASAPENEAAPVQEEASVPLAEAVPIPEEASVPQDEPAPAREEPSLSRDEPASAPEAASAPHEAHPAPSSTANRQKRVRELDFARPSKFSQDVQRRIARGHDAFCRAAQTQLSAELRTTVELEMLSVDQQTWSVAVNEMPALSLYGIVSTSAGLPLLLGLEDVAVTRMIERLLGGTGIESAGERDLTEIEIALATKIFLTLVTQLSRTWQELLSTDLTLTGVENQQANIQLAPQSEPTLSVAMELRIDELVAAATLLVPHRSVEVLLVQLPRGHYGDGRDSEPDAEVEAMLRSALSGVTVEVRVEVGSRQATVDEVVALRPGDVVPLSLASSGVTLYADAVPIYRGRPGRSANRRAVEVLERMGNV